MKKYHGSVVLQFDDTVDGNAGIGKSVTVRKVSDNSLANLFSDNGVTPITNPTSTDALGKFAIYTEDGTYNIIVEEGTAEQAAFNDVQIYDSEIASSTVIFGIIEAGATRELITSDSGRFLVFDEASNATAQIPDGLPVGFAVLCINKSGGTVTAQIMGAEQIQGGLVAPAGTQFSLCKITSNLWQTSETP